MKDCPLLGDCYMLFYAIGFALLIGFAILLVFKNYKTQKEIKKLTITKKQLTQEQE